ncbi:MAG TPA: DUF2092 domain-containing protein [Puia sp.]|jgi:hypothetical protein|nr:DUF2092 domain-containing protein [Puia sp.]
MYKKFLFVLFTGILTVHLQAQTRRIDTVAVSILDKMSAVIGDLSSCSVTIRSNYDVSSRELGLVKHSDEQELFLRGSSKLLLRSEGDKGSRYLLFNGKNLSYYSMDRNQYSQVETPASLIEMIDTVNKLYGIEFPIADFFYPSFVDDILAESKNLMYLGLTQVDGKECFHIAGTAADKTFQFWVSNDAWYLPMKIVIVYTNKEMNPQYEAVLSNWQVNPNLPDAIFQFTPPVRSKQVRMVPLKNKK